jgi:hypothetical protein
MVKMWNYLFGGGTIGAVISEIDFLIAEFIKLYRL